MIRSTGTTAVVVDPREYGPEAHPHLADAGIPYVRVSRDGRLLWTSEDARPLMRDPLLSTQIHEAVRRLCAQRFGRRTGELLQAHIGRIRTVCRWPTPSTEQLVVAIWPCAEQSARVASPPGNALTKRELEVAALAEGALSTKEIAAALCISTHTARRHLENVHRKLGVRSRGELVLALETLVVAPPAVTPRTTAMPVQPRGALCRRGVNRPATTGRGSSLRDLRLEVLAQPRRARER